MKRACSLDAFRGYAILTMILSGTILTSVLPPWMSHAQVGPRSGFTFDPSIYGITWVDLVFPFFLFAMGAAFPFSIGRKLEKGETKGRIVFDCLLRGIRLTFFAIFIQHMYPWSVSTPQGSLSWGVAITAFFLLFPMFIRLPKSISRWVRVTVELGACAVGIGMMLLIPYANGRAFSLGYSNIIILVLANMVIFGSLIYLFTYRNRWSRVAVLPFVMAVFLGSTTEGSWIAEVMNFTPLPWMYRFFYLKYLFIVIPGSVAGEYLREWLDGHEAQVEIPMRRIVFWVLLLAVGIIVWNLYGLYTRKLVLNLWGTVVLLVALYLLLRGSHPELCYWRKLYVAGAYLLLLGLCFEAYEGGIRKDDSTYSYYFVTSGLAFMGLMAFSALCDVRRVNRLVSPLQLVGQNPMIAYVAPQLLIMPLLHLTGLSTWLDMLNQNAWAGFLRGVIVTTLALCVAVFCTKKKWFWRT